MSNQTDGHLDAEALKRLHLTIDSHVVVQLGSELVTDAAQALQELVKNAFDADATYCKVEIQTDYEHSIEADAGETSEKVEPTAEPIAHQLTQLRGRIKVHDDGHGMDLRRIADGWLVISASSKRSNTGHKEVTKRFGRTPLGDKGLGRLSTMKLGDLLTITTFTEKSAFGVQISFRWSSFKSGVRLEDVELAKSEVPKPNNVISGTTIEIVGLNDWEEWRKSQQRSLLSSSLSRLVNPFPSQDRFSVELIYDRHEDLIDRLSEETLHRSAAQFHCTWRPHQVPNFSEGPEPAFSFALSMRALLRPTLFLASNKKRDAIAHQKILASGGKTFLEYLSRHKETKNLRLEIDEVTGEIYHVDFLSIDQIGKDPLYGSWAPPGAFDSKLYYFMLPQLEDEEGRAIDSLRGKLRDRIASMAGVYIFRDGFGVRSDRDWLRLGSTTTSGSSFYGLRPNNVLGRVILEGSKSETLVETSNREHFVDNAHYRGFMVLNRAFIKFCNNVLGRVRRAANDFLSEQESPTVITPPTESELERLASITKDIRATQEKFQRFHTNANASIERIARSIGDTREDLLIDEKVQSLLIDVQGQLASVKASIELTNADLKQAGERAEQISALGHSVNLRFERLQDQIENLYESAALGLSARGMAHEIATFLDEISSATARLKGKSGVTAVALVPIDRAIRSIRQYLAVLDPMLPNPKVRKERFKIRDAVQEYLDARSPRLTKEGITINLVDGSSRTLSIKANKGQFIQVLDNLVRNSEYWLVSALQQQPARESLIQITFHEDGFSIEDTGPGVNTNLEDEIFDLFISDKPDGERSGLGLFIVKALLESMGGGIDLDAARNSADRRYKFNVRFGEMAE